LPPWLGPLRSCYAGGFFFLVLKRLELEADYPPPCSAKVKNPGIFTSHSHICFHCVVVRLSYRKLVHFVTFVVLDH
jgi:hypothetical protein